MVCDADVDGSDSSEQAKAKQTRTPVVSKTGRSCASCDEWNYTLADANGGALNNAPGPVAGSVLPLHSRALLARRMDFLSNTLDTLLSPPVDQLEALAYRIVESAGRDRDTLARVTGSI
jgi:hypothetical protein